MARGVDALVLAPSHDTSPELARALRPVRTPIVLLDREVPGIDTDAVHVDQGPGIGGRHGLPRRRGAATDRTADPRRARPGRRRQILERYQRAPAAASACQSDPALVRTFDDLDRRTGRDGVDALLAAGAEAIISTGTMEHTTTVLERLTELGVAVPRDVALVVYGYVGQRDGRRLGAAHGRLSGRPDRTGHVRAARGHDWRAPTCHARGRGAERVRGSTGAHGQLTAAPRSPAASACGTALYGSERLVGTLDVLVSRSPPLAPIAPITTPSRTIGHAAAEERDVGAELADGDLVLWLDPRRRGRRSIPRTPVPCSPWRPRSRR